MISGAVAQKYRAATIMKWLFLFTSLMLLPFGFKAIPEEPLLNGGFFTEGALLFAYIVIFSTAIGYFHFARGAQKASGDDGERVLQPAAHCGVRRGHRGGTGYVQLG